MYYRLHVVILKQLLDQLQKAPLLEMERYLKEAAAGPFANNNEKKAEKRDRL